MTSVDTQNIVVKIPQSTVSVSHMSNLLRVLQATVREFSTGQLYEFDSTGLPILVADFDSSQYGTTIKIRFGNSIEVGSSELEGATSKAFDVFKSMYIDFLNQDAQSDLWVQLTGVLKKTPGTSITVSKMTILFNENGFGVS